jgi:hypothetical protein
MSEYTPGRWALELWSGYVIVRSANGGPALFFESQSHPGAVEDARLIAAAPELLEALQLMERNSLRADWPEDIYSAMVSAIARATGESA